MATAINLNPINAPQRLFGDIPASAASIPGMVTPNTTAALAGKPIDYGLIQALQDRNRGRWASAAASQNADRQAADQAANKDRVRAAFDQLYGPQLQRRYHDQMVMSEGVAGTGVPRRIGETGTTGQSRLSSGNMTPPGNPAGDNWTPEGGWYKMDPGKQQAMLDSMWRDSTDPYMKTAASLGGDVFALGGGGRMIGGGGGGRSRSIGSTKQAQPINPFPEQSLRERVQPTGTFGGY